MRKAYRLLLGLGAVTGTLTSCNRATYQFTPQPSAYLQITPLEAVPPPITQAAPVNQPVSKISQRKVRVLTPASVSISPVTHRATLKASAKHTIAQVFAKPQVLKQVAKIQAIKQNTAETAAPASRLGRAGLVTLVGLGLMLLAVATKVGLFGTIGAIAFIVGLILVIIALVNGD